MMKQNILPFKLSKTEELITANSGIMIYLEMYKGLKFDKTIRDLFPKPGSAKGFEAKYYVLSMILLFLLDGKYIEDVRKIKLDRAMRKLAKIKTVPTADAIGNWMRNDSETKIQAIEKLHYKFTKKFLKLVKKKEHILDIDAFQIYSKKEDANYSYKNEKGYMPIVGHLADLDWLIAYEFREGQISPADRNYEFILKCFHNMPKEHKIVAVRSDAAAYQADIFNWLDQRGVKFTITGAEKGAQIGKEIALIPESNWKGLKKEDGMPSDREYAETYHKMDETEYFRVVVQRRPNPKRDLFGNEAEYCYYIICTNYSKEEKTAKEIIYFHRKRAASENYYKEAKQGFNLNYLPCGDFKANAIWFAMSLMAYNFHIFAKEKLLPTSWRKKTIRRIRFELINIAGKVTKHAKQLELRLAGISDEIFYIFDQARRRLAKLCYLP